MKHPYKALTLLATAGLLSTSGFAETMYLRGDFNGWSTSLPLSDVGGGVYSATVTGGTAGNAFEFKVANADWSVGYPGGNAKSVYNLSGDFIAYYIPTPAADGWSPAANRVGYADPGQFGWDVMGSFNSWSAPVTTLAAQGNGLYTGDYTVATPGTYDFKFRKAGDWAISIGNDFANSAGNISLTTTTPNELISFQLDLPDGRFQAVPVPEPSQLWYVSGGALTALGVWIKRRRTAVL